MSAMADMSRAIRHVVEDHGGKTLRELPDEPLNDFVNIIGAFYLDLKAEQDRRAARGPV